MTAIKYRHGSMGDAATSRLFADFGALLKRRSAVTSVETATRTVELLRELATQRRWSTARDLIHMIREAGTQLAAFRPEVPVVGNMVRHVLKLARDTCMVKEQAPEELDASAGVGGFARTATLHDLLLAPEETADYSTFFKEYKGRFMSFISDLLEELEDSGHNIASQALEHIHADEVIMTYGASRLVELFLLKAASVRRFQVIAVETAPSFDGQSLALRLGTAGIETTVITDSAVFAMLARVNKVIVGTDAVLADGGLLGRSGLHGVCLAARHHSVPVIVLSPIFKLTPSYLCAYDADSFNNLVQPADILPYSEATVASMTTVVNPLHDYVPPQLVSLFVTNLGGSAPSYVYQLLREYYHEDDFQL